jgi:hypothetical protein
MVAKPRAGTNPAYRPGYLSLVRGMPVPQIHPGEFLNAARPQGVLVYGHSIKAIIHEKVRRSPFPNYAKHK